MSNLTHQYIDRATGSVADERLMADKLIRTLYSAKLEEASLLSKLASSRYVSEVLGYLNYDNALSSRISGMRRFLRSCGINPRELVDDAAKLDTPRKVFAQDQILAIPSTPQTRKVRGLSSGFPRHGRLVPGDVGAVRQREIV